MINPMDVMNAQNTLANNHPKAAAFFKRVVSAGVTEGTVIEMTVTKPGEEPITTNIKVTESDIAVLRSLGMSV
ncbi:MAG: hypothetical protein IJ608_14425 [Lachnospiraceae bacterium]|nr:hypothetical protein [Lachnospiraceae bacterium]